MEIKRKLNDGVSKVKIAKEFKVSKTLIVLIATGKRWAHIKD